MSIHRKVLTVLLAGLVLVGCGGGSGDGSSTAANRSAESKPPRPGLCRPGASALAPIPGAPAWWRESKQDPIALACLPSGAPGGAALVGFPYVGASCVVSYSFAAREDFDDRCTEPGTSWTVQCEGTLGCTSAFVHEPDLTQLDGPVDAKVKRIEVTVGGKPLEEGLMFVSVAGRLAREIGAREPFGFFFVSIPRCVSPGAVRIELLGADRSRLGFAQGWDVAVQPCRKPTGKGASSA